MNKTIYPGIKKIRPEIERIVEEKIAELLGDPDAGLSLKASFRRRLAHFVKTKKEGIPADKIARKYGIKW